MNKIIDILQKEFDLKKEMLLKIQDSLLKVQNPWQKINEISFINQHKVLKCFQKYNVSDFHLNGSTGYGYGDTGRDLLEEIWADIFGAEKALVRSQIVSGTHAIALCLFGILQADDEFVSVSGTPYDTFLKLVGKKEEKGTLSEMNVKHKIVDLTTDGDFNYSEISKQISEKTKMICLQRSRGYSWRPSLSIEKMKKLITFVKRINPEIICFVDNCYGEFVEIIEPTQIGADIIAGSLIKNPGGGLAPRGGYIAGKKELVYRASCRLTAPGIVGDVGSALDFNRPTYQGLFMAPHITEQSLKGAVFAAELMTKLGYNVSPLFNEHRTDIIQAIMLGSPEKMRYFCQGIQKGSPVDSHVVPQESLLPGYNDPVIMAAGTFVQGSSIELSADGPIRPPYIVYLQGGLSLSHYIIGLITAINNMECNKND